MDATTGHPTHYDSMVRAVHWLTLALIAAIFAAAWTAHSGLAGDWYQPVMQLHRSLGVSVWALTVFRLARRRRARIPALPNELHPLQKLAAHGTEALLYVLLLLQPILGLLQTNARGQPVDFYFLLRLPAVIGPDRPLARQLHDLHALAAEGLLILIGMHAAAALFHHVVRRDDVLNTMLPAAWRDAGVRGRSAFALRRPKRQT
jgi:cytochrome b561